MMMQRLCFDPDPDRQHVMPTGSEDAMAEIVVGDRHHDGMAPAKRASPDQPIELSLPEVRTRLVHLVRVTAATGQSFVIIDRGQPAAALVPAKAPPQDARSMRRRTTARGSSPQDGNAESKRYVPHLRVSTPQRSASLTPPWLRFGTCSTAYGRAARILMSTGCEPPTTTCCRVLPPRTIGPPFEARVRPYG